MFLVLIPQTMRYTVTHVAVAVSTPEYACVLGKHHTGFLFNTLILLKGQPIEPVHTSLPEAGSSPHFGVSGVSYWGSVS